MWDTLSETGLWRVAERKGGGRSDAAPFDLIKLNLGGGTGAPRGTVRARNLETRLGRIRVTAPGRFVAAYDIRGHHGLVEGTLRPDGSLRLDLSGTVTGTFVARAADPADADGPVPVPALAGTAAARRVPAGAALTAAA